MHARDSLSVLFPGREVATSSAGRTPAPAGTLRFGVVPSARHPRLLVPLTPRAAAPAALRAYGGRLKLTDRVAYRSIGASISVVGARRLPAQLSVTTSTGAAPAAPGIDDHLSRLLGVPVAIAVHLTPARANRKPIVQALAANHSYPVAFAKVATNALTSDLISHEVAALELIASSELDGVAVPALISNESVNGHQTLVMRPLPTWSRGRLPDEDELVRASAAVAGLVTTGSVSLRESAFWRRLRVDIEQVATGSRRDGLQRAADGVERSSGSTEIAIGAAHGDWSPWNMWKTSDRLLVWDWERFATDVPVGTDLVHYRLQELLVMKRAEPIDAARAAIAGAPDQITAILHLLALAVRYEKDDQTAAGAAILPSDQWLLPAVNEATGEERARAGQPR